MSWLLTWYFFPRSRKELSSPFLPTQKLREASSATTQTLPVSHPAMLLSTSIPWPSPCMGERVHPARWSPLKSFRWGTALFPPHHLLICPPRPSLCQVPVYCLSSPNAFFALLCDMGSGLCKHFSFASWLNVRLCQ